MISWLIVYENEGKKGNDFSKIPPFEWLVKYREKLPDIVLVSWTQENVLHGWQEKYDQEINIENDFPEVFKEPVKEVETVKIKDDVTQDPGKFVEEVIGELEQEVPCVNRYGVIDPAEELKKKRLANLKKARDAKKAKTEAKEKEES